MSYCVNCGVELAKGEEKCPLCFTPAYRPEGLGEKEAVRGYPVQRELPKPVNMGALLLLIALIFTGLIVITVACDLIDTGRLTWSAYSTAALVLLGVFFVTPILMPRNTLLFSLIVDYTGIAIFLFIIERLTSGSWYMNFGLPVTVMAGVFTVVPILLTRTLKLRKMSVGGIVLWAVGLFCICVDSSVKTAFFGTVGMSWSWFVLIPCGVLGLLALIIDRNAKVREEFRKRFFI